MLKDPVVLVPRAVATTDASDEDAVTEEKLVLSPSARAALGSALSFEEKLEIVELAALTWDCVVCSAVIGCDSAATRPSINVAVSRPDPNPDVTALVDDVIVLLLANRAARRAPPLRRGGRA